MGNTTSTGGGGYGGQNSGGSRGGGGGSYGGHPREPAGPSIKKIDMNLLNDDHYGRAHEILMMLRLMESKRTCRCKCHKKITPDQVLLYA